MCDITDMKRRGNNRQRSSNDMFVAFLTHNMSFMNRMRLAFFFFVYHFFFFLLFFLCVHAFTRDTADMGRRGSLGQRSKRDGWHVFYRDVAFLT